MQVEDVGRGMLVDESGRIMGSTHTSIEPSAASQRYTELAKVIEEIKRMIENVEARTEQALSEINTRFEIVGEQSCKFEAVLNRR